jgi:hypothetical protein
VFELAELNFPAPPLRLKQGAVYLVAGSDPPFSFPEAFVAEAKNGPEVDDMLWKMARMFDFDPTRYWELPDLIEASLMVLDLAEVVLSTAAASESAPTPVGQTKPRNKRGPTTKQRLRQLLDEVDSGGKPIGKMKIAAAGSAKAVGAIIGRSKTQVIDAGEIYKEEVAPLLETGKSIGQYERIRREDERLGR